jgi:hypothetical protein
LMSLFNVPGRAEVVACRGTGEPTCILRIARMDGRSNQSEAA